MEVVEKRLNEIKPYEKNPRLNEKAVSAVAKSISEYGFKVPIVIDSKGVIVTGHTRYKAAKSLGLSTVPCIIADDLTDKQIKAFRIADNKVSDFSICDNKLLLEELEGLDDIFTGFTFSEVQMDVLNEADNSIVDDNEFGVTYEIVLRSDDKQKIEKIQKMWDEMEGDDDGKGSDS